MKLLFCNKCNDLFALSMNLRKCECGESKGNYVDSRNVEVEGSYTLMGINNQKFFTTLALHKAIGEDVDFEMFTISKDSYCS